MTARYPVVRCYAIYEEGRERRRLGKSAQVHMVKHANTWPSTSVLTRIHFTFAQGATVAWVPNLTLTRVEGDWSSLVVGVSVT